MATQSSAGRSRSFPFVLGPALRTVLWLALTIAVGTLLVSLVIFAPASFLTRDQPLSERVTMYLQNVGAYLFGLLRGEWGPTGAQRIGHELWMGTLRSSQLLGISLLVALPLGIGWGALLATARRGLFGAFVWGMSTLVISLPSFMVLMLAIEGVATLTLRTGVRLAYVQGYGLDRHLILPTSVLALRGAAFMARAVQVAQDEISQQDWIRVARAKGMSGLRLWRNHVLPGLGVPLLGSALGMLRVMVSGLIIIDYVYGWGGLGRKLLQIANNGQITAAVSPVAAGAAVLFVIFFALTDLCGKLIVRRLDPRLRDEVQER